jgi:hypothetical protein
MEKIVYPVWKHEGEAPKTFRQKLLNEIAPKLLAAGARRLSISVVDEDVAPADPLRIIATRPPVDGLISIWVDTAIYRKPLEEIIEKAVTRMAGYLVTESQPLVNTKHPVRDGERVPGMNSVVFLTKPPRLSYEQWIEIWHGSHTQIAIETQSTFGYKQNVIVRPLTYAAPPYDAIVEENFPAEAMTDPQAFYNAVGDDEKRQKRELAMIESCARFIDFDKLDRILMSEYIIKS